MIRYALAALPILATGLLAEPSVTVVPKGFKNRNPTFLTVTKAIYEKVKKDVPKKMEPYTETVAKYENNKFEMLPLVCLNMKILQFHHLGKSAMTLADPVL